MKAIRIRQRQRPIGFKKVLDDPTVQGVLLLIPPGKRNLRQTLPARRGFRHPIRPGRVP